MLFSRQDKILHILDATILIFYRKLYINILSIIDLNVDVIQYNIKINLTILFWWALRPKEEPYTDTKLNMGYYIYVYEEQI